MNKAERLAHWNAQARKALVGRKIIAAQYVQVDGMHEFWIGLDDGTTVIPMADDEGNGPGSLHMSGGKHGVAGLPVF